ncbi:hypothetical protein AVEN_141797-1 [Araneus ventricosus]|uniref:DUF4817 domain-containing protein n=1 Tax=Araneus ventricosus TaxID=182803 RepID=A0A4Y2E6G2_ARAVE|nr:hypothetical protein AVEN_141797-1 [Araneus ventricosus]
MNIQQIFLCLLCSKCHENVKAVQRAWQEEFHNKNWPDKRIAVHTIDSEVCSRVIDGLQNRITAVLVKESDVLNEGNIISYSAALQSVKTLLDYMGQRGFDYGDITAVRKICVDIRQEMNNHQKQRLITYFFKQ